MLIYVLFSCFLKLIMNTARIMWLIYSYNQVVFLGPMLYRGCRGRSLIVFGFPSTNAISAYHH
jgi:hypothetical protein